jgi:hypothetical protein
MIHNSGNYDSNKNYRPLNDPLFNYILEKYTPKVEIIMTPHYTYKYYHDVTPFYSNDDIILWKGIQHNKFRMRTDSSGYIVKGPDNYAQGTMLRSFYKAINSQAFENFTMKVWYRDGEPIIGQLLGGQTFANNNPLFHDKQKEVNGKTVYLGTICYPRYAIKDMTVTQSDPIGIFEQSYYVSSATIKKRSIALPEGAVNPSTITVTYNQGINLTHPSNFDSMIFNYTPESGYTVAPESPPADWSGDPVIFPNSFEQKTYTVRGESMTTAPDFSIASTGGQIFCELTPNEFHECELELINQQYEKAKSKYRVYDIPSFILPKGFTNEDLPPEINRKLPTT